MGLAQAAQIRWSKWSDYEWYRVLTAPAPPRSTAITLGAMHHTACAHGISQHTFTKSTGHDRTCRKTLMGGALLLAWLRLSPASRLFNIGGQANVWVGPSAGQEIRLAMAPVNPFKIDGSGTATGLTIGPSKSPFVFVVSSI